MKKIIFVIILVISFILRLYHLDQYPSGLHADEASFLVNAVSIAQTGKDEDGKFLPLSLRSLIDPKPALYSYLEIPFISIMSITTVAARLPGVLFGMLSIILIYFLIKKLLDQKAGLLSMFLIGISPWHIDLSRGSQEVIMGFCFSLGALLLFLLLHKQKNNPLLYICFLFSLLMSLYSYPSVKVFLPTVIVIYTLLQIVTKKIVLKKTLLLLAITILSVLLLIPLTDTTRFNAVSIFTSPQTQLLLNEKITTSTHHASAMSIRLFNNKIIDYGYYFFNNYLIYFSGGFLFGGINQPQRYQIPFTGMLFPFEVIFLITGVFFAFYHKKTRQQSIFMAVWLLASPLPAAATIQETPSIIRSFPMLVPLIYFITVGILYLINIFKRQKITQVVVIASMALLYLYGFGYFWFNYTVEQTNYHPWYRNYQDEQLAAIINDKKNIFKNFYISNSSYMYFVLNNDISIQELQNSYPHRFDEQFHINKFIFVNQNCFLSKELQTIYAIKNICVINPTEKNNYKKIAIARFKDNNPAYTLYEYIHPKITLLNGKH